MLVHYGSEESSFEFHFAVIMVRTITRWTEEETALLLRLVDQYRNNFKLVASVFPSRSYN